MTSSVVANESVVTARQRLEAMSDAMKRLNYQGSVVFLKNGQLDSMKYSHVAHQQGEQERLLSLNLPQRETIRDAEGVRCLSKDTDKVVMNHHPISKSFIIDLPVNFLASASVYSFDFQADDLISMHPTYVVSIKAKDAYRYNRQIWIDKLSSLPLQIKVFDLAGQLLEQVVFTDFQGGEPIHFIPFESDSINTEHVHQSISTSYKDADFILKTIPQGFDTVFFTKMRMDNSTESVGHLLLSDGFASVSVYSELKTDNAPVGLQTLGSVNAFTHVVGDFYITAMGEVPATTVKLIAEGAIIHSK